MQSSGAVAPRFAPRVDEENQGLKIPGLEALRRIGNQVVAGVRVEIKFSEGPCQNGLMNLVTMQHRGYVVLDELSSAFVDQVYVKDDITRRHTRAIILGFTEDFKGLEPRETFFKRVCPYLAYVQLLQD